MTPLDPCPTCGDNREAVDTGPGWVAWHCTGCGMWSREEVVEP